MKSYFKYTTGDAFQLDNSDYTGLFKIESEIPYSWSLDDGDSKELQFKSTFSSDFFQNQLEFSNCYNNIDDAVPVYSNVFNMLNHEGFDTLTKSVNLNNLKCFKGMHVYSPTIYNFDKNNNLYYGAISNSDGVGSRQDERHIEPFTVLPGWEFMDSITTGAVFVNSSNEFKYICSVGDYDYVLKGSFDHPNDLSIIYSKDLHPRYTTTPDFTYHIHNDLENKNIFFVNTDYIKIYDSSNYDECDKLPLIDQIPLKKTNTEDYIFGKTHYKFGTFHEKFSSKYHIFNDNNPYLIKFGRNTRSSVSGKILTIYNKYSTTAYRNIDLSLFEVDNILDLDISPYTGDIAILHKNPNEIRLLTIFGQDPEDFTNNALKDLVESDWYRIKFSNVDSDQVYIYSQTEVQTRAISNSEYPIGYMKTEDLCYVKRYKFSNAILKFSTRTLKFGSGKYESNNFNNQTITETIKGSNMHMLVHNKGRLICLKQPIADYLYSVVPSNIQKYFTGLQSSEASLGLYINAIIFTLIKDTLNLLTLSEGQINIEEYEIWVDYLKNVEVDVQNLAMQGNDTINVITLQRILTEIYRIQSNLISK